MEQLSAALEAANKKLDRLTRQLDSAEEAASVLSGSQHGGIGDGGSLATPASSWELLMAVNLLILVLVVMLVRRQPSKAAPHKPSVHLN